MVCLYTYVHRVELKCKKDGVVMCMTLCNKKLGFEIFNSFLCVELVKFEFSDKRFKRTRLAMRRQHNDTNIL